MALAERPRRSRDVKAGASLPEEKIISHLPDRSPDWFDKHNVLIYRGELQKNQDKIVYVPDPKYKPATS